MSIHPDPNINRLNVLGEPLASCCFDPITGYFRNGFCHTAPTDLGQHTVCAQMTSDFLNFSQKIGNDLITQYQKLVLTAYNRVISGVFASPVGLKPIRQVKHHQLKFKPVISQYCLMCL